MRHLLGSWSVYAALALVAAVLIYGGALAVRARRPAPMAGAGDPAEPAPNAAKHPGAFMGPSVKDAIRATGGNPDDAE